MSSYTFDHLKEKMAKAEINFDVVDGAYKVALVTSAVFENEETGSMSDYTSWSEVSAYEISEDAGYNSISYVGSENINNIGFVNINNGGYTTVKLSASDVVYPISTIDANGAVIYANDANKTLICAVDFGRKIISNNGTFTISLSNGFLQLI